MPKVIKFYRGVPKLDRSKLVFIGTNWNTGINNPEINSLQFIPNYKPNKKMQNWDASLNKDNSLLAYKDIDNNVVLTWNTNIADYISCTNNLAAMFLMCTAKSLDLTILNTLNATRMSYMFSSCFQLRDINVLRFDTSNVTLMDNMFSLCYSLTELNLSKFNTAKVTNMSGMFYGCKSLKILNISGFDFSNVKKMKDIFHGCSSLEKIKIGSEKDTAPQPLKEAFIFKDCPETLKIYVPRHLVEQYKSTVNWSIYGNQIISNEYW